MLAADRLESEGYRTSVVDARFMKPLDTDLLTRMAREHDLLVTVEEGAIGGFGAHVAQFLSEAGELDKGLKLRALMLPDIYIDQDSPSAMYDMAGLNAQQIVAKVRGVYATGDKTMMDLKSGA